MNDPTPKRGARAWLVLLGAACALPVLATEYRFPEKPYGLDTPAGRCVVCHSLEKNGPFRVAPNLHGIVGAEKARAGRYNYSQALREKGGTWTEDDLDAFLENASAFAPGSTKSIRVADAEARREIIDYLKKELAD
jgi:cytochrome c